jgi:hypothetical protein
VASASKRREKLSARAAVEHRPEAGALATLHASRASRIVEDAKHAPLAPALTSASRIQVVLPLAPPPGLSATSARITGRPWIGSRLAATAWATASSSEVSFGT